MSGRVRNDGKPDRRTAPERFQDRMAKLGEERFYEIREAYCQGILTIGEILERFDLDPRFFQRMRDHFRWTRDYKSATRQALAAKLMALDAHKASVAEVAKRLEEEADAEVEEVPVEVLEEEDRMVDSAADLGVLVQVSHRRKIRQAMNTVDRLLAELEATTANRAELEELWLKANVDDVRKQRAAERAFSLPQRMIAANSCAAALRTLVSLERKAYSMDEEKQDEGSMMKKLHDTVAYGKRVTSGVRERLSAADKAKVEQASGAPEDQIADLMPEEDEDGGAWEALH